MNFKIGMPTLIETRNIVDAVALCKNLGLSFIELNTNLPVFSPENLDPQEIKKIKENTGIEFTIHQPDELDLSNFHSSIRDGFLRYCITTMKWAAKADIRLLTMHLNNGNYFTLPERKVYLNQLYKDNFTCCLNDSFEELTIIAAQLGISLNIENCSNFHMDFISDALTHILNTYDIVNLTWDIGHDAKTGYLETGIISKHKNRISHMHLHDFDGINDHKPLYTGNIEIDRYLKLAKELDITTVIEVKTITALKESVLSLKSRKQL